MAKDKNLIVIPTYNEKENISRLISAIRDAKIEAAILVVDDSSPDKTGEIVENLKKSDDQIFILHRKEKAGLGRAYVAGFKWALEKNYKKIISMDADFSHPVEALLKLIELCDEKTLAIGSRYIRGGKIVGWRFTRYLNSWGANLMTRLMLGIKAKDATAGFKCYPAEFLQKIDLDKIQAAGYAFQVEMLLLAQDNGFKLVETPITFVDRTEGQSKIQGELRKSAQTVFRLATQRTALRQFVKFAIVGAVNTVLDWAVFYAGKAIISKHSGGMSAQEVSQIAKIISFTIAATSSYIMNRRWTFRSQNKKIAQEASRFLMVSLVGLLINSVIFYLVTAKLNGRDIFGLIIATAGATLWNFFANRKWTFGKSL